MGHTQITFLIVSSGMSEATDQNTSSKAEKPKPKVNFDKLYDKLFTGPQQQKKEQHKS